MNNAAQLWSIFLVSAKNKSNFKDLRVEESFWTKKQSCNLSKVDIKKWRPFFDFVCFNGCHFTQPGFTQISVVGISNFLAFLTCLMVPIKISCHLSRHNFLLHSTLKNYTVIPLFFLYFALKKQIISHSKHCCCHTVFLYHAAM